MTVFLEVVLNKKYPNPSSDIISVLTGLEDADAILSRFVGTLETAIRDGRTLDIRRKAVRATIATVAGAYQTGLVSYFVNRDLFPALLKVRQSFRNASQVAYHGEGSESRTNTSTAIENVPCMSATLHLCISF